MQGKCNGKSGHFPAAYVERLQPGQRIFQVTSPIHINEGDVDVRFHKDQVREKSSLLFIFILQIISIEKGKDSASFHSLQDHGF